MLYSREETSFVTRVLSRKPSLYWWLVLNVLVFCLAVWSWVFFLEVFGNPHTPRNNALLEKMGRLKSVKSFDTFTVPEGATLGPQLLYKKYYNLSSKDLFVLNTELKRVYVNHLKDDRYTTYVQGQFRVLRVRLLNEKDFITKGIVIQTQALVQPDILYPPIPYQLLVEWILPNAPESAAEFYAFGDVFELRRNPYYPLVLDVLRIEREGDEPLISLSCVPLAYKNKIQSTQGEEFTIAPPQRLHLRGSFPLFQTNKN